MWQMLQSKSKTAWTRSGLQRGFLFPPPLRLLLRLLSARSLFLLKPATTDYPVFPIWWRRSSQMSLAAALNKLKCLNDTLEGAESRPRPGLGRTHQLCRMISCLDMFACCWWGRLLRSVTQWWSRWCWKKWLFSSYNNCSVCFSCYREWKQRRLDIWPAVWTPFEDGGRGGETNCARLLYAWEECRLDSSLWGKIRQHNLTNAQNTPILCISSLIVHLITLLCVLMCVCWWAYGIKTFEKLIKKEISEEVSCFA